MSVYVDPMFPWPRSKRWPYNEVSHLIGGTENQLHRFAKLIGLKRKWFQKHKTGIPHYDLTRNKREQAIRKGAIEISRIEFVKRLREYRERTDDAIKN